MTKSEDRYPVALIGATKKPSDIDPAATLTEQVGAFRYFLEHPPAHSIVVTVSFTLAEYILDEKNGINVKTNRRRESRIDRYARVMRAGLWTHNGAPIIFSDRGWLRDGWHRLTACARSNASFKTDLRFGIDDDAFVTIDIGASRSGSDILTIHGHSHGSQRSQAIRWLIIFTSDNPESRETPEPTRVVQRHEAISNDEARKTVWEEALKDGRVIHKLSRLLPLSTMTALAYLYRSHGGDKAVEEFVKGLRAQIGPAKALLDHLGELHRLGHGRVDENLRNRPIIETLNAYAEGRSRVKFKENGEFPAFAFGRPRA